MTLLRYVLLGGAVVGNGAHSHSRYFASAYSAYSALGLASLNKATSPYANPTIFLFLGGFILGIAMETCNLHKRIALNILKRVGISPKRQIAGFMIATAFISMWMSNTATAVMMTPIGISVATLFVGDNHDSESVHFQTALLLGIAYAASIGGLATLIGTPPNALLRAFFGRTLQYSRRFWAVDAFRRAHFPAAFAAVFLVADPRQT